MFGGGGGFFGGGGMPFGGMPEMRPRKQDNRYYDLLGVNPKASDSDIKKSFMKLARKIHPDKGGQNLLSMLPASACLTVDTPGAVLQLQECS